MSSRGSDSLYLSLHFHFSALVMKPLLSSDISIWFWRPTVWFSLRLEEESDKALVFQHRLVECVNTLLVFPRNYLARENSAEEWKVSNLPNDTWCQDLKIKVNLCFSPEKLGNFFSYTGPTMLKFNITFVTSCLDGVNNLCTQERNETGVVWTIKKNISATMINSRNLVIKSHLEEYHPNYLLQPNYSINTISHLFLSMK